MKKYLLILSALLFLNGCSNLDTQTSGEFRTAVPSSIYKGNVCVSISEGAPFATKADDAMYYTLVGEDGETVSRLVLESTDSEDGLVYCKHFSEEGDYIATLVYVDDDLLNMEIAGDFEITKADKAASTDENNFRDCVKETYHEMRETLQKKQEITCDFGQVICDAVSAVAAVVSCTGKDKDND